MRHLLLTLIVSAFALCLVSGCAKSSQQAAQTPEAAFAQIQKAAADGDIAAYYDLCDDNGQAGLCELAWQLITMEIYARHPDWPHDPEGIKRAFQEELNISPEHAEQSESDPKIRRGVFFQIMAKSQGPTRDTLKEGLFELTKYELISCTIEREGVARLQLKSNAGEKSWYMIQENGRWVIAGGMSPSKPE